MGSKEDASCSKHLEHADDEPKNSILAGQSAEGIMPGKYAYSFCVTVLPVLDSA